MCKWLVAWTAFFIYSGTYGQTVAPEGQFMQREAKIGEEIVYAFSVEYPRTINLVFPDSSYNFEPFEFNRRTYFTTKSDSTTSFDSAVYYLSTFEIDSIQYLQLPLFVLNDTDCTAIYARPDSILFKAVVEEMPEQVAMIGDTRFAKVKKAFNYPYFLAALGVLIIVLLVIMGVFGKRIGNIWRLYLMKKAHQSFTQRFFNLMRDVSSNNPTKSTEQVLSAWKKYMEKLEKAPFTKWTTKEISTHHPDDDLKNNLRSIDRSIYSGQSIKDLFNSFDFLLKYSTDRYHSKMEEVKNG